MKNIISFILSIYTSLSFCNELQLSDRFERGVRGDFKHDNKIIECENKDSDYKYLINYMISERPYRSYDAQGNLLKEGVSKMKVIAFRVLNKKSNKYELKTFTGPFRTYLADNWSFDNPGLGLDSFQFFNRVVCNSDEDGLGLSMNGKYHFNFHCPDSERDLLDLHLRLISENGREMAGYFYLDLRKTKFEHLSNKDNFQETKCQMLRK